jgi:hypothetical protein
MQRNTRKGMIAGALVAAATLSVGLAVAASVWTGPALVQDVYSGYTGQDVYVTGPMNKAQCAYATIRFRGSDSDPELVQKMAVAAMLAGKKLDCVVNGCIGGYQSGRQCRIGN